jgi:hypothetical protein
MAYFEGISCGYFQMRVLTESNMKTASTLARVKILVACQMTVCSTFILVLLTLKTFTTCQDPVNMLN